MRGPLQVQRCRGRWAAPGINHLAADLSSWSKTTCGGKGEILAHIPEGVKLRYLITNSLINNRLVLDAGGKRLEFIRRLFVAVIIALALIPEACTTTVGGGTLVSIGGHSSAQGIFLANGDGAIGYGEASGDLSLTESHWVQDTTGKRAEVYIDVDSAAELRYAYSLSPNKDGQTVPRWAFVSAQESITATDAKSIDAYALAENSLGQAKAQIIVGDVDSSNDANLISYTNSAKATALYVKATQNVRSATGDKITIDTSGAYGSDSSKIKTVITSASGLGALFKGSSQSIGAQSIFRPATSINLNLKGHIEGAIDSKATADTVDKIRNSNDAAIKADLNDNAWTKAEQGYVSGSATFYVDSSWGGKIQSAVDAAWDPDLINVADGTYNENVKIDKSLTVKGAGAGKTTVDGQKLGSVFSIGSGAVVTLDDMTITNGQASYGGGIYNDGTLNLKSVLITGNTATLDGGGIFNNNYGTINLNQGSTVGGASPEDANIATYDGGGIYNVGHGTINLNKGSSIVGNNAERGGGIYNQGGTTFHNYFIPGTATVNINGGSITDNTATYYGGGIYNYAYGDGTGNYGTATVIMNKGSSITGNTAGSGGGIWNRVFLDGTVTVTMNQGSSITDNTATYDGGGICNDGSNYGTIMVTMNKGSSISGNTAEHGGGIYNKGGVGSAIVNMNHGSSIYHNTATYDGGGICNSYGTVNMNGGSITDNKANRGGGIFNGGTLTLKDVKITDNTASVGGGGIFNAAGSTVNMYKGSLITGNKAKGNTVTAGGGILNAAGSTVNMYMGSLITGNTATYGGGIFNAGGIVNMYKGSSITGSTAYGAGGGIYNSAGTVNMYMGSLITGNTAYDAGGGIKNFATLNMYDRSDNILPGYDPNNNDYLHFFGPRAKYPDNTPDDVSS
jgi:hypothetical protein